ncbi:hypothetical protein P872_12715 [Rhodonellum psychrophilum GCM71 = DSM 17998]|uniref:Uncharacterized protein n=1 Tax=Rhodonellum psychrophilum GCM71 = DSM 17998 TaxID=1123057 RepID=U5BRR4_9BACT|nr:hypothetical protein P872_12715 [Rhodonellum psychrophilum GCM71 = DSM 17998]
MGILIQTCLEVHFAPVWIGLTRVMHWQHNSILKLGNNQSLKLFLTSPQRYDTLCFKKSGFLAVSSPIRKENGYFGFNVK